MGFRWPTMPGSGQTEVFRQVGNIGAQVEDLDAELNLQQAQVEYQDFKLRQRDRMLRHAEELKQNPDENTYHAKTNKLIAQMQADMPNNGLAKRFASEWVKNEIPNMNDGARFAVARRIKDKSDVKQGELIDKAIRTGNMVDLAEHTSARVEFGYMTGAQAQKVLADTRHGAEVYAVGVFAASDPEGLLAASKNGKIDGFVLLTPQEVRSAEGAARSAIHNRGQLKEEAQDKAGREMLVDLWNRELTNPQDITDALERDEITVTMASGLRKALLDPKDYPAQDVLIAETQVRNAIDRYQSADITDVETVKQLRQDAIDSIYTNAAILGKTKGSSLLAKIYDEVPDKAMADMTRQGKSLMEEYIRSRDPISGMFKDSKQEIMMTAEAQLLLDIEIEKAEKAGKPLGRRDIMIKAVEIGQQQRNKLDAMSKKETVPVPTHLGTSLLDVPPTGGLSRLSQGDTVRMSRSSTMFPAGTVIGKVNSKGGIELNENGVDRLLEIVGGDATRAREYALKRNYTWKK